jgi:hypothetical protein
MWSDKMPGSLYEVHSDPDSTFRSAQLYDASLANFLSRPLKIREIDFPYNLAFQNNFNPWAEFLTNPRVINRITNFNLLRGKLHLKVVINGNGFHYGRVIVSYNPLYQQDDLTVDRAFIRQDVIGDSQRPHIYVDPTHSQGGELVLPFFFYKDAMSIPQEDWNEMGEVYVKSINPLQHANGGTDIVSISVFAWLTDVELSGLTSYDPTALTPQSGVETEMEIQSLLNLEAQCPGWAVELVDSCHTPEQILVLLKATAKTVDGYVFPDDSARARFIRSLKDVRMPVRETLFLSSITGDGTFVPLDIPPIPPPAPLMRKQRKRRPPNSRNPEANTFYKNADHDGDSASWRESAPLYTIPEVPDPNTKGTEAQQQLLGPNKKKLPNKYDPQSGEEKEPNESVEQTISDYFQVLLSIAEALDEEDNEFEPQAGDEYGDGPISYPASVVARMAKSVEKAPVIGKYARATSIAAGGMADIARLFGYCAPCQLDPPRAVANNGAYNMSVTNTEDYTNKLAMDAKQELCVDPRTTGLSDVDEMAIKSIVTRESYLNSFTWSNESAPETLLVQYDVTPVLYDTVLNTEIHCTPMCYIANLFDYWRGSIKFRFQVVGSSFHKGRLKIVYDPVFQVTDEYNTNYTTVIDIAESKDFTVEIGWGSPYGWLRCSNCVSSSVPFRATPRVVSDFTKINGTLSVFVVNELTSPSDDVSSIEVNTFVKGGDDLEFAVPADKIDDYTFYPQSGVETASTRSPFIPPNWDISSYSADTDPDEDFEAIGEIAEVGLLIDDQITRARDLNKISTKSLMIRATMLVALITSITELLQEVHHVQQIRTMRDSEEKFKPQSGAETDEAADGEATDEASKPIQEETVNEMAATNIPQNSMVYFGEEIKSLRALLKRYDSYTTWTPVGGGSRTETRGHPNFPLFKGYAPSAVHTDASLNAINYVRMTHLNYITAAYAGFRGGIRWMQQIVNTDANQYHLSVKNRGAIASDKYYITGGAPTTFTTDSVAQYACRNYYGGALRGTAVQCDFDNHAFKYEIPYYRRFRMTSAKRTDVNDANNTFATCQEIRLMQYISGGRSVNIATYVAAAEDYTCFWFLSCPILYDYSLPSP